MALSDSHFDLLPHEHLHPFPPEVDLVLSADFAGSQRKAFLKVVENRLFFRFERQDANWNFVALENLERKPDPSRLIHLRELFFGALSGQGGVGRIVHVAPDAYFLFEPFGKITLFVANNEPLLLERGERLSQGSFMAREANFWLYTARRLEESSEIQQSLVWLRLSQPEKMRALVKIEGDWDEAMLFVQAHARREEALVEIAKGHPTRHWFVWIEAGRTGERGIMRPYFHDEKVHYELDFSPRFRTFAAQFTQRYKPCFDAELEKSCSPLADRIADIRGCPIEFTLPEMTAHEMLENELLLESWRVGMEETAKLAVA